MSQNPAIQERPSALAEFAAEFLDCWRRLPNKFFFFALLAAWLFLFQFYGNGTFGYIDTASLMGWMKNSYFNKEGSNQDSHGAFVPLAVLALMWIKRKELFAVNFKLWWPGLLMLGLGLLLHVFGYMVQQPRVSIVGFFIGIYGLMGLAWGPGWLKESFFPYFLFGYCIPISSISQGITVPLRMVVSETVWIITNKLLGLGVIRVGTQLFDAKHTYAYEVAAACSGIQSLLAIVALNTVFAFLNLQGFWRRAFMILAAVPLALASNVFRLLIIILAAEWGGSKWGDFVHENFFFSLLPYLPSIGGAVLLSRLLEKPSKARRTSAPEPQAA